MSEDVYEVWIRAYVASVRSGPTYSKERMVDRAKYIAHQAVDDFKRKFKIVDP